MPVELIANAIVAVLLVVMIGYSFMLNKRLDGMRKDHQEMSRLIASLNSASEKAQQSVQQLRAMGQEAEHALKMEVAKARALADELSLITEAGSNLADRIDEGLTQKKEGVPQSKAGGVVAEAPEEDDWLLQDDQAAAPKSGNDLLSKLRSAR